MTTLLRYAGVSALAITTATPLAACGSVRYPQQYVLQFAPTAPPQPRPASPLGSLAIRPLDCPSYLCDGRLVYREGPHRIGFYDYHRWAVDPGDALTRLLAERIQATSLFEPVAIAHSTARSGHQFQGRIERFEEVDQKTGVEAICTISAAIIELNTGAVIWSGNFSERVLVPQRDVSGVVVALSTAAQRVADRLADSIAAGVTPKRLP